MDDLAKRHILLILSHLKLLLSTCNKDVSTSVYYLWSRRQPCGFLRQQYILHLILRQNATVHY